MNASGKTSQRGLQLDRVVLLGRGLEEYRRFFGLELENWRGKRILDVAAGVSSFTAEANSSNIQATAVDPIYGLAIEEIRARSAKDLEEVAAAIGQAGTYCWDYYKSPEEMAKLRARARDIFLQDFQEQGANRYVRGSLPKLPFEEASYDMALVSYFLLVYEKQFSYEFHREAIGELLRVAPNEVRIYPTVTFEAEESAYLRRLERERQFKGYTWQIVKTDFEFLKSSNCYLRISRK